MSFVEYYNKTKDDVYNYFLYRLNFDKDLAEDMTSDVFLKAFDAFNRFDQERSFKAWVMRIAHNHLINYFRDKKVTLSLDETMGSQEDGEEIALSQVITDESYLHQLTSTIELKLLIEKIQMLPSDEKQIIILRAVNDMSFKEIADVLDKTEGNARVIYKRAIDKFRLSLTVNE